MATPGHSEQLTGDGKVIAMFKQLAIAGLLALLSLTSIQIGAAEAQTNSTQRSMLLESIQTSVIKSIGAQDKTVEVSIAGTVLVALRVNSNMNNTSHAGRNNEAIAIADIASKAIGSDPAYADITTIRVQYLSRDSTTADGKVIDTVEFRRNPKGFFEIHLT